MSLRPSIPPAFRAIAILFATLLCSLSVRGQNGPALPNPPHHASPPAPIDREQILAYWTTETGWTSELQLRNNQGAQDLTVTPVLRIADGAEIPLAPITIKPQEVKSMDIDASIGTTSPQLVGTYGSLALRYRSSGSRSLYAALMIRNVGHPIAFHIDASAESQQFQAGSREGIWWLPKETTNDYLILTNQGQVALPVDLSLYDAAGRMGSQRVLLGPHETARYSVRKLVQAAHLTGSYGGIKVSAISHAGSLDTLHFLFDEQAAFSAILKMFDHDPSAKLEERDFAGTSVWTLRAPMLALSNPDPSLMFPPGTTLQPQLFIRNTTNKPADIALRFNWRSTSGTGNVLGPALRLSPNETRRIDVAEFQKGGLLPKQANWTSVTLTTKGSPDEIMAVAASYDETLRYGAQTPFSDQLTFKWEGGMWEYDPYHNSIITAGNGGTRPTQVAFTIFYNQGLEKYELEQTLKPDEQMWIDVGKLIRERVPDKNGKVLPADLTMGSYEFRDLTDTAVGILFEGKVIYDKTYGHVTYGCAVCCAFDLARITTDPLGIPFQGTATNGVIAFESCLGDYGDVSGYFFNNWSSANTAVATVNATGTHTGVGVGSTTSSTWANLIYSEYKPCVRKLWAPIAHDNVMPTVTIDSFSPNPIPTGGTANAVITVNPSANVNLAISSSGTGTATFGTNGNTTLTIPGTTTINITAGSLSSNGAADLTLTASYGGSRLISINFSVTSGACTATYTGNGGGGVLPCPVQKVQVYDTYAIQQFCSVCTFTCIPVNFDSTFTPDSKAPCVAGTVGVVGSGNRPLNSTVNGRFAPTDCNVHNLQIKTTIVNAQGTTSTNYTGGTFGLKCNSNGSPSCQ